MFAGENIVTPAPTILSMMVNVTLDDAVPMIASTFWASIRSAVWLAWSVVVSPESPAIPTTSLPNTPPASLISWIARSKPANSGGPR